jgi:ABC-type multidrug transport system fused ATPase/permease subunit
VNLVARDTPLCLSHRTTERQLATHVSFDIQSFGAMCTSKQTEDTSSERKDQDSFETANNITKLSSDEIIRRLCDDIYPEAPALLLGSVALLGSSLANQMLPRLLGRLIDGKVNPAPAPTDFFSRFVVVKKTLHTIIDKVPRSVTGWSTLFLTVVANAPEAINQVSARVSSALGYLPLTMHAWTAAAQATLAHIPRIFNQWQSFLASTLFSYAVSSASSSYTMIGMVVIGGGIASCLRTVLLQRAEDSLIKRLQQRAFASILTTKSLQWFQTSTLHGRISKSDKQVDKEKSNGASIVGVSPGSISKVLNENVSIMARAMTSNVANLVRSLSSVVFSSYQMYTLDPALLAISAVVLPAVGFAAMTLRKAIQRLEVLQRERSTAAAAFVEERLVHFSLVKLANREQDEIDKYSATLDENFASSRSVAINQGALMGFLFVTTSSALILVVHVGVQAVVVGRMTSGQLTSFVTYSFLLGLGTSGVVKALAEINQGLTAADQYYRILDSDGNTNEAKGTQAQAVPCDLSLDVTSVDSVSLKHIQFKYDATNDLVLRDISMILRRGTVIGVVG